MTRNVVTLKVLQPYYMPWRAERDGAGYDRWITLKAVFCLFFVLLVASFPAAAQEPAPPVAEEGSANPLAALNEQVKEVLAAAQLPFTDEQERAIALMMEERRRATEELFGSLMDFRGGPTQGQEEDRLRSAIDWMRTEFLRSLADYLTPEQNSAWTRHQTTVTASVATERTSTRGTSSETQYVRINNNVFTSENNGYGSGGSTEVIQRGGTGAWHGNSQFLMKDDALNARNPFAGNKPPYQERRLSVNVSGPTIPGRLSTGVEFQQTQTENVGTIRATLPEGVFALGITRPNAFRNILTRNTVQITGAHSIRGFVRRATETARDQNIGGFTLPERRSDEFFTQWNTGFNAFSSLTPNTIHEARFQLNRSHSDVVPFSEAVRINVLDAFNGGGAQNRSESVNRQYEFGNLLTRLGETLTIKTGIEGVYRAHESNSTSNFYGTFTFSSLDSYLAGQPVTYRVTRGNPLFELGQLEMAGFFQADVKINSQVMLMAGVRYEAQQNLDDYNNIDPRVSLAYSPSRATVIRAGGGIFHKRVTTSMVENVRRLDGTRRFEIIIDNPTYPDPFAGGTIRQTLQSIRVMDPDLAAPYYTVGMLSLERTFFSNLLFTATYDFQREYHRLRSRDLNAPYDARFEVRQACTIETPTDLCVKPDPTRGSVLSLESTGNDYRHNLRLSARKRFSIFNGTVNYNLQNVYGDVQGGDGQQASDTYNLRYDWGRAPMPRHNVSGSLNAQLPLGVFVSGNANFNSGRHYTVTTGTDDNRDSNVNDRPSGVSPNTERGPRYFNVDFNASKAFFFRRAPGSSTSGMNANVFVNMTNAFNKPHLGTPSGVMTSPNFRRVTSASDPREIEVGVRFQF